MEIIVFFFPLEKVSFYFGIMAPNYDIFQYNPPHLSHPTDSYEYFIHLVFHISPSQSSLIPSPQIFIILLNLGSLLANFGIHSFLGKLNPSHYFNYFLLFFPHLLTSAPLLEDKGIWYQCLLPSLRRKNKIKYVEGNSFHDGVEHCEFLDNFRRVGLHSLVWYCFFRNFRRQVCQSML